MRKFHKQKETLDATEKYYIERYVTLEKIFFFFLRDSCYSNRAMLSIIVSEYLRILIHVLSIEFFDCYSRSFDNINIEKKNASQWLSLTTRPRVNQCRKGIVEFDGINSDDWFN